jgi:glycyl-tRNA synthetase beta chain
MGGIYARVAGEPERVWKAIYYHYLPVAVEADAAPTAAVLGAGAVTWAAVSLADKLDTLVGLFLAGERPTGSRDPLGLRRQAHGILRILMDAETLTGVRVRTPLATLVSQAAEPFHALETGRGEPSREAAMTDLGAFLTERVEFVSESRGAVRRNIRAVLARPGGALHTPISDLQQNLHALPEFARSDAFRALATAFKRVRNIAREYPSDRFADDERTGPALESVLQEPAERALVAEIEARRTVIESAVSEGKGFRQAYLEASYFAPIVARFFEEVFVMSDDPAVRQARLRLVKRLEALILQLGDISEIVTTE